jgi:hypothetical protein
MEDETCLHGLASLSLLDFSPGQWNQLAQSRLTMIAPVHAGRGTAVNTTSLAADTTKVSPTEPFGKGLATRAKSPGIG